MAPVDFVAECEKRGVKSAQVLLTFFDMSARTHYLNARHTLQKLLEDGRMAFFDFGLFKRMPTGAVELEMSVARAVMEGDKETIMRLGTDTGFFPEPEKFDPDKVLEHFRAATSWYTVDEYIQLTPEFATQVLIDMSDPRSEYFGQLRHESAPPDHIFGRRMEVLTLAVISQLRARGNFHRITREWFYGDEPATELGEQEASFYARAAV